MAAKWTSYSLVPGGGNFYTLPEAKREAQIEANRRDMGIQIHSVKHDGNYLVSGSAKYHGIVKPKGGNPRQQTSKYRVTVEVSARSASEAKRIVQGSSSGKRRSNPYPDLSRRDEPITLVRPVIAKLNQAGLLDGDAAERTVELMTRRMSLSETDVFDVVRDAAQRSGGRATSQAIANVFRERLEGNGREIAEQLATYRIQHI